MLGFEGSRIIVSSDDVELAVVETAETEDEEEEAGEATALGAATMYCVVPERLRCEGWIVGFGVVSLGGDQKRFLVFVNQFETCK